MSQGPYANVEHVSSGGNMLPTNVHDSLLPHLFQLEIIRYGISKYKANHNIYMRVNYKDYPYTIEPPYKKFSQGSSNMEYKYNKILYFLLYLYPL